MNVTQAIRNPHGVSVFGSALVRVEPDTVALSFAVSCLHQQPKDSFRETREAAQQVRGYLAQINISEVGSSRISLTQSHRYDGGVQRFLGYKATVSFRVLLRDLSRLEEILTGVVEAGANEIHNSEFQTTRLKEVRAQARQQAVEAARAKAENYCGVAGVRLGAVIHIEDVDPDKLRGSEGHVRYEPQIDEEGTPCAFDPASIVVGAAVVVAYRLEA